VRNIINNCQHWVNNGHLILLLKPIADSIARLESSTTTLADCKMELLRLGGVILLADVSDTQLKRHCIQVYNKRYAGFNNPIYTLALYLHPKYDILFSLLFCLIILSFLDLIIFLLLRYRDVAVSRTTNFMSILKEAGSLAKKWGFSFNSCENLMQVWALALSLIT
jgi:hypothetical protein